MSADLTCQYRVTVSNLPCILCASGNSGPEPTETLRAVGETDNFLKILSATVALCDGSIFATQQSANRAADNVRTAKDDSVLACDLNAGLLEKEHDSGWSAG